MPNSDFIGTSEQYIFSIEDTRERADKLKKVLAPKLMILLEKACDTIHKVYGADALLSCRKTTTPAHRPGAKKTMPFEMATAGLIVKGKPWYFQQRFECTADSLYVSFFGLRGPEANPIIQVMKKHVKHIVPLLEHGADGLYSEAIASPKGTEYLKISDLINDLEPYLGKGWKETSIKGQSVALPIKDSDAAQPVIDSFVTLFPIFRAAANVLLGEDDCFEKYLECYRNWQESLTTAGFYPDEVDSAQVFREGAVRRVSVNAYERDKEARQKCIDHYGSACSVCGFDFGKTFGERGKGFIHVHHLIPVSEIAEEYEVDPVEDLRPVCPNCHAMIHRRPPPLSIEEIRILLNSAHGSV
ncbi:HNH endonuclease [Desulfococcaceae bacterium HSG8]|nr:HNH endonuclease [Desulfococcaceae bacterium HSG8]